MKQKSSDRKSPFPNVNIGNKNKVRKNMMRDFMYVGEFISNYFLQSKGLKIGLGISCATRHAEPSDFYLMQNRSRSIGDWYTYRKYIKHRKLKPYYWTFVATYDNRILTFGKVTYYDKSPDFVRTAIASHIDRALKKYLEFLV